MKESIETALLRHEKSCSTKVKFDNFIEEILPEIRESLTSLADNVKWLMRIGGCILALFAAQVVQSFFK